MTSRLTYGRPGASPPVTVKASQLGPQVHKSTAYFPHLGRFSRALSTREGVQKVCQKEGFNLQDYASPVKLL